MSTHTGSRPGKDVCRKTGKVAHKTRKTALTAGAQSSAYLGKALRAYKCRVCRRWHLTSRTKGT